MTDTPKKNLFLIHHNHHSTLSLKTTKTQSSPPQDQEVKPSAPHRKRFPTEENIDIKPTIKITNFPSTESIDLTKAKKKKGVVFSETNDYLDMPSKSQNSINSIEKQQSPTLKGILKHRGKYQRIVPKKDSPKNSNSSEDSSEEENEEKEAASGRKLYRKLSSALIDTEPVYARSSTDKHKEKEPEEKNDKIEKNNKNVKPLYMAITEKLRATQEKPENPNESSYRRPNEQYKIKVEDTHKHEVPNPPDSVDVLKMHHHRVESDSFIMKNNHNFFQRDARDGVTLRDSLTSIFSPHSSRQEAIALFKRTPRTEAIQASGPTLLGMSTPFFSKNSQLTVPKLAPTFNVSSLQQDSSRDEQKSSQRPVFLGEMKSASAHDIYNYKKAQTNPINQVNDYGMRTSLIGAYEPPKQLNIKPNAFTLRDSRTNFSLTANNVLNFDQYSSSNTLSSNTLHSPTKVSLYSSTQTVPNSPFGSITKF